MESVMESRQQSRVSALALTIPGLGRIVRAQATHAGMRPGAVEFDGRSDVLVVSASSWAAIGALATVDDVLADLGTIPIRRAVRATVDQLDRRRVSDLIERLGAQRLVPPGRSMRVVVRMTSERYFLRTALRAEIQRKMGTAADHANRASVELWALQIGDRLRLGIRLPAIGRRDQPARPADRPGSLRPAVAAAMVTLVDGAAAILDPTCGTGTVLLEASASGGIAIGGDRDRTALDMARTNGCARLVHLDARQLPFTRDAFDAVVANLPFGQQHSVQGSPVAWYRRVLTEALRVAPRAVVLAPVSTPFRQALGRLHVEIGGRYEIRLLGQRATIWSIAREGVIGVHRVATHR